MLIAREEISRRRKSHSPRDFVRKPLDVRKSDEHFERSSANFRPSSPSLVLQDFQQTLRDVSTLLQRVQTSDEVDLFRMDEETKESRFSLLDSESLKKPRLKSVKFDQDALSVVLPFASHAPPAHLFDNVHAQCVAYPDPGDEYIEAMREKERLREEEERKYVHGVVVHDWKPPLYNPTLIAHSQNIVTPYGRDESTVRVEDIRLRARTVVGVTIVVKNLCFNKRVLVRYSLDKWQTAEDLEAKYVEKLFHGDDSWDKYIAEIDVLTEIFKRDISLPESAVEEHEEDPLRGTSGGRMHFAVLANYQGIGDYWDNNCSRNFEVEFRRRKRQQPLAKTLSVANAVHPNNARKDSGRKERVKKKQDEWMKIYGPNE